MYVQRLLALGFTGGLLLAGLLTLACGGSHEPARLTLDWSPDGPDPGAIMPADFYKSRLVLRNEGGATLKDVQLRFDQNAAGYLPFGVSVGTATNVRSSFDGNVQVWNLGDIAVGQTVVFPMTLWIDSASRTAEPMPIRLIMQASSPALADVVTSNTLEVVVNSQLAPSANR
jgi:hypothetical protein